MLRGRIAITFALLAAGVSCSTSNCFGSATPTSSPSPKVAYTCVTPQTLFSNWNGGGVVSGGSQPQFDTKGVTYCLKEIATYHWNGGGGAVPGTLGLRDPSGKVLGPWKATASAGQGNAPNVNWTYDASKTSPVILNGIYQCVDSSPTTWSSNPDSGGRGFCRIDVWTTTKT